MPYRLDIYHKELIISLSKDLIGSEIETVLKHTANKEFCFGKPLKYDVKNCIGFKRRPWQAEDIDNYLVEEDCESDKLEEIPLIIHICEGKEIVDSLDKEIDILEEIKELNLKFPKINNKKMRIIHIWNGIDEEMNKVMKKHKRMSFKITPTLLNETKISIYIKTGNEIVEKSRLSQISEYVIEIAKTLSEMPYKLTSDTISTVKKRKIAADGSLSEYQQSYMKMLKVIPGVSEERMCKIVEVYPTLNSLYNAYEMLNSEKEKKEMLENIFGKAKQKALSETIYKVFNSSDPNLTFK